MLVYGDNASGIAIVVVVAFSMVLLEVRNKQLVWQRRERRRSRRMPTVRRGKTKMP